MKSRDNKKENLRRTKQIKCYSEIHLSQVNICLMSMQKCQLRQRRIQFPFICNHFKKTSCSEHRLPENHQCPPSPENHYVRLADKTEPLKKPKIHKFFPFKKIVILSLVFILIGVVGYIYYTQIYLFSEANYENTLRGFLEHGYSFVLPFEWNNKSKIVVLVHDCDANINGVKTFVKVERKLGVRSTFFLRVDAEYFTEQIAYFQQLEHEGWEIGFHYDCLSRANGNMTLALIMLKAQITYLRTFFNVTTTRYHGDIYNFSIGNDHLYQQNQQEWQQLGLREISNNMPSEWQYYADVNKAYPNIEYNKTKILLNLHSDWW